MSELLNKNVPSAKSMKGFSAFGAIIGTAIGIVVAVILLPVITTAISNGAFTGNLSTVVNLIPIIFALGIVVICAAGFGMLG